jgi:ATP-dependent RNA helicase RhlE
LSFKHLNLIEPLLKALDNEGYTVPTPIQEQAIPIILNRKDLLGCAQTGTGKTAAFALPLLQLLCEDAAGVSEGTRPGSPRPIRALVLTPTRELAIQIDESFEAYGKFTGIRHTVIFGGVPQHAQVLALQKGVDVLVATPGRLLDLIDQRYVHLQHIRYFVLDEADRMLDMGFIHDIRKVLTKLPAKKHSLFFSATMPPEIQKLANTILVNPMKVEVTPEITTAETVQQSLYFVEKKDKRSLLLHILKDSSIPTALVFTRTKHGADKVAQGLVRAGIRAEAIHGNKSQNARQRALENFKSRHTRILVATDIAARGIDIDELTHVINFELPNVPETYVHRIGRTGRAGASGIALSFCDQEETEYLRDIQKLIARSIPVVEDHPQVMVGGLPYRAPIVANHAPAGRNGGERRSQQPAGRRPEAPKRREEPRRNGEVKRPEVPKRNDEVKRTHEPKRKEEFRRPEAPKGSTEVKRPEEPKRRVNLKRNGEVKPPAEQKPYEPTNFPFQINQSEGDEKW